ncbi:MAG TPA: hypothetical protein VH575_04040 [Gemmataceae bacterium]|jgi:hypothetical protein
MSEEPKIGARVRVTTQRQVYGYQTGCGGVVLSGPTVDKSGKIYFSVRMDKDDANDATFFRADEIEPIA